MKQKEKVETARGIGYASGGMERWVLLLGV